MAEDDKGYGPWSRVPVWDGSPITWRRFKRDVTWWLSSLDLSKTTGYNLAARFLLRQDGVARQRGEEFLPEDLAFVPVPKITDPQTGESFDDPDAEPDYLVGINKLMQAWEDMNGHTALDKRGELRQAFYMDLSRRPAERVSEFCTRFRSLTADLKAEGVNIGTGELGWWLRQKVGLDPLRRQWLDTALQGSEDYGTIESEILRLFRDLHENDPLCRRLDKRPLTIRRMFASSRGPGSSLSSAASTSSRMTSATSTGSRPSSLKSSTYHRQVNVTENIEEEPDAKDDGEPADDAGDDAEHGTSLEEILQTEAEVLAAELNEAEQEGVDPQVLDDLEIGIEQAAETLVTMREARQQLQSVRKDRGYKKPGDPSTFKHSGSSQVASRKASGKFPCYDCGESGHWAGDAQCKRPGQGLGRKKPEAVKKPMRQVRVTETEPGSSAATGPPHAADVVEHALGTHDLLVTEVLVSGQTALSKPVQGAEALNLEQALSQSVSKACIPASAKDSLPPDKELVGALDSACNRTCAGPDWLKGYLCRLQHAPSGIRDLVQMHAESENFRFGNNGVVPSLQRWRLPAMLGETLVMFWVSMVPISTLGCLIGRDLLESVGAVLDFSKRTLSCAHIDTGILQLRQMLAGHFLIDLLPSSAQLWGAPTQKSGKWRRCGQDGVVEIWMSSPQWLQYKLQVSQNIRLKEHEHFLTESSLQACHFSAFSMSDERDEAVPASVSHDLAAEPLTLISPTLKHNSKFKRAQRRRATHGLRSSVASVPMASHGSSHARSTRMARSWSSPVGFAATILALLALSLSQCCRLSGLEAASGIHDASEGLAYGPSAKRAAADESFTSFGMPVVERQNWISYGIPGGSHGWQYASGPWISRPENSHPSRSNAASARACGEGAESRQGGGEHSLSDWAERWIAYLEGGLGSACSASSPTCSSEGHCGVAEGEDSRTTGNCCGNHEAPRHQIKSIEGCYCHDVLVSESSTIFKAFKRASSFNRASSSSSPADRSAGRGSSTAACDPTTGSALPADVQPDDDVHSEPTSDSSRSTSRLDPQERPGTCSNGGRGCIRPDSPRDGLHQRRGSPTERRTHGRAGRGEHEGLRRSLSRPSSLNDFKLDGKGKMKTGIKQMISQAWDQHCRDRVAVSKNRFEVFEVLATMYDQELRDNMNETFVQEVDFPDPIVTEIYSDTHPVASEARRQGLRAGESLTLSTGWDFYLEEHRQAAKCLIQRQKPYVLVIAFPCGPWSLLMNLNAKVNIPELREKAKILVSFAIELCWLQIKGHRHFVLENPLTSAAWTLACVLDLLDAPGVFSVVIDQCMFGLQDMHGQPHRKATRLATSLQALISLMQDSRCDGSHQHAPVIGGSQITRPAGHYPKALAAALVKAFKNQFDFETRAWTFTLKTSDHEVAAAEANDDDVEPADSSDDELFAAQPADKQVTISAAIKRAVYRLHENTGHRSGRRLARALLVCGAPREAVLAAKQLKCDVCEERKAPKARRPASLPQTSRVGAKAHIDLLMIEDAFKQSYYVVHITDSVSRYQMAAVIKDKSTQSVIQFLMTHWIPLMGSPEILVADQGREFVSLDFDAWCSSHSVFLYHIGVQCPWQNGIAERSGATLKALVGAVIRAHTCTGYDEVSAAIGEAVAAYNADVNEEGVSPLQAVTGRQQPPVGDVLAGVQGHLAEHSIIDESPLAARQVAMRDTARVAMVRLHFSRGLRRAELARARSSTLTDHPQPGDLCYYWRESKYQRRKGRSSSAPRHKIELRKWHGPAMLVAIEGNSNCFLSHRGQLTKCGLEHVRKASALEQVAAGSWEEAIKEVIESVPAEEQVPVPHDDLLHEDDEEELRDLFEEETPVPAPFTPAALPEPAVPLTPLEVVAAIQPARAASNRGSTLNEPTPPTSVAHGSGPPSGMPGTPTPSLSSRPGRASRPLMSSSIQRARSLDSTLAPQVGDKRAAAGPPDLEAERAKPVPPGPPPEASTPGAAPAFEALFLSWEQLCNLAESTENIHPLLRLEAFAEMDRRAPFDCLEADHGSWDGRWSFLCEREWELQRSIFQQLPAGDLSHESMAVQTSRREYEWSKMNAEDRKLWGEAAIKGWQVYVDNEAVEVLSMLKSAEIRKDLTQRGETDKILRPRFVLTDKADGLRTETNNLEKRPSARLVVPGFKDHANLSGKLRRDAPTGCRLSQHLLFCIAAWNVHWLIISGDVKSAFLKGDPYVDRTLYISGTDSKTSPPIPLAPGQLAVVRKGIFGLADAPRQWWLRLSRSVKEHHWEQTLIDGAMWLFWLPADGSSTAVRKLGGIMVAHVDDLLFCGGPEAQASFDAIGAELGFGSKEVDDFVWCGKRIRRAKDGTVRLSMQEYHKNIKPIYLPRSRKSDPSSPLTPGENKQLRALLGSMQWLVAQLRFDLAFTVSTLQGERPTIATVLKANSALKEFQDTASFEMIFRPVNPEKGGIMVVTDAALGNVTLEGVSDAPTLEKVYSQACYFVLLADEKLMSGSAGYFNVLDARSHRIPRVCRSSYAAETLSTEEGFDVGRLCRGFVATALGHDMYGKKSETAMDSVSMQVVVDAKDVHDKTNSDTPSYGAQKSLAFSVAWLRSELRRPRTCLRWTSTENMWADAGTKQMDLSHMRRILSAGCWSVSYSPDFVKQVYKASKCKPAPISSDGRDALPGEPVAKDDAIFGHLMKLAEQRGWHTRSGMGINVAFNAKSHRTPEPRFSVSQFPLRSTYARFEHSSGQLEWRCLEAGVKYSDFSNQHALFGRSIPVLVTLFHSEAIVDL